MRGTAGLVNDAVEVNSLLHGQETDLFADAGHQGQLKWHVAMRPGLRKLLDKTRPMDVR